MDQDSLNVGEEWRNEIDLGIIDSDALILILTPESCTSSYVTYEWAFAIGRKKKVIPLLYKPANIHPRISVLQYLDFTNQRKGPWDQLFNHIKKASRDIKDDIKPSNLVSGMTVEDLKQLLSGAMSLANATAKNEGRNTSQGDISEAAINIANANINLGQSNTKLPTILWVDDTPENNVYEQEAFSALGFKIDLALSTTEALQKLKFHKYNAIISDMGRVEGRREGYVLLEKLRVTDKATPYFIYAGSNSIEHKKEAEQHGAQGSTNNPHELIESVTKYVSIK
jgi:CheY-like chemotaxis protein